MARVRTWLRWLGLLWVGALVGGCYIGTEDGWIIWDADWNSAPWVMDGEAWCGWDDAYGGFYWDFEAWVSDWDGAWDVREVWADVYEADGIGWYVDSVRLYRETDPELWYRGVPEAATGLWCGDRYIVEIVAEDDWGATDRLEVPLYMSTWTPSTVRR